jgi:hypothetical protein
MFSYDQALLGVVRTQLASVADVASVLQQIEATCEDGDGLKWFNWLYLQVTQAVKTRVASGGFADPAWLAELDIQFAKLYFSAFEGWLEGQPVPDCWKVLFERRSQPAIARIQFALAGVNAHINHDLPAAIVATCAATGTAPQPGDAHYRDYTAVNTTLDTLIDSAKQTLNVRLLGDSLPPVSHLEDTLAAFSVSAAREAAWRNAEILWHLQAQTALSSAFLNNLDGLTGFAGRTLLVPVP